MDSLGFSTFRHLMDLWDHSVNEENNRSKIESLLDVNKLLLFFKKDGDVFGSGEDARVTFAKMKNPDKDLPSGWVKEASFTAKNLTKELGGDPSDHVFNHEDLKDIKIIDREKAEEILNKQASKKGEKIPNKEMVIAPPEDNQDPDAAQNFIHAREKN